MSRNAKHNFILPGLLCLVAACLTVFAYAEEDEYAYLSEIIDIAGESGAEAELMHVASGGTVTANVDSVYLGAEFITEGYLVNGRAYVSAPAFCAAASPGGPPAVLDRTSQYLEWNGRCFWVGGDVYAGNGEALLPLELLAACCGASFRWDADTWNLTILPGGAETPQGGDAFYNAEDLYWLSRIIFAEAGNQPLAGKIGVGNVVLNRVASPICPDTIYDVIFDSRFGVQFTPTENGTIYNEPSKDAVAAAKLCFEGVNTVGNSLYFVNPAIGSTRWFRQNCVFVCSIGQHEFYA